MQHALVPPVGWRPLSGAATHVPCPLPKAASGGSLGRNMEKSSTFNQLGILGNKSARKLKKAHRCERRLCIPGRGRIERTCANQPILIFDRRIWSPASIMGGRKSCRRTPRPSIWTGPLTGGSGGAYRPASIPHAPALIVRRPRFARIHRPSKRWSLIPWV